MRGYMLNRLESQKEAIAELANFKSELKKVSSSDSILEVRLETNRLDDCIKLYSDIIEMHPSRINAYKYRSIAYLKQNKKYEACVDINSIKTITLNPNYDLGNEDLKKFAVEFCK